MRMMEKMNQWKNIIIIFVRKKKHKSSDSPPCSKLPMSEDGVLGSSSLQSGDNKTSTVISPKSGGGG
eukprot:291354-Ditylum_brightwellii.AAC.1